MDAGWAAILGAITGASAVIVAGFGVEAYKRHRDRKGIASALAGEIAAILEFTRKRNYEQFFRYMLQRLDAGEDVKFPTLYHGEPGKLDPIADKHVDKLGVLQGDLPERVAHFHYVLTGIRTDMIVLPTMQGDIPGKRHIITEDLALWKELVPLAIKLVDDLREIARPRLGGLW